MTRFATALVAGAGIAGLAAAAALAGCFDRVIVIDRDSLPADPAVRPGAGQGAHTHQLLKAGEDALERLLPGVTQEFLAAGAVPMRVGRDIRIHDFGGPIEACDAGFSVTSLSRPLYEHVLRSRVAALPGVSLRTDTTIARLIVENGACIGVELEGGERVAADLVIDATGLASPLLDQLADDGHAAFPTESVRINVAYATARLKQPPAYVGENQGVFVLPAPPAVHFGLMLPIEDNHWMVSLGARGKAAPPRDLDGFRAYAGNLAEPAVFERIRDAELSGDIRIFRKPTASRRRIWEATKWPERLLPLGDALSSVNPTYGQGMSVAALEAEALAQLLANRATAGGLDGLPGEYLPIAGEISTRAWSLSVNSDYVYPETEGERPPAFAMSRAMAATLRRLADEDLDFRIFRLRLVHLLESATSLRDGPLALRFFTALQGSMAS